MQCEGGKMDESRTLSRVSSAEYNSTKGVLQLPGSMSVGQ
jgi:hypothetical protein